MEAKTNTYYIAFPYGNVYFHVNNKVVYSKCQPTQVSYDRFIEFLHTAELLGFKIGQL